ncbi:Flp family type IVb pilin [Qipengyuania sp. 6B39]|uniref:Flp family type IVb pilin n=1 Tax=Qipengyuania proteolytica TaxID=2867239 RepID=UPI001C89196A|nr:Flp family type IVb pilin [Qipengyuania proteolytica]MBX7495855.1 Flp family type IVb pilin [Qipengyuania proteolytica]
MVNFLNKLGRDESGATAVEYGLILALIFLAMVGAIQTFGTSTITMWNKVQTAVSTATSA